MSLTETISIRQHDAKKVKDFPVELPKKDTPPQECNIWDGEIDGGNEKKRKLRTEYEKTDLEVPIKVSPM